MMRKALTFGLLMIGSIFLSCDRKDKCSCHGATIETLKDVPMSFHEKGTRGFLYKAGSGLSTYTVCDSTKLMPFKGVKNATREDGVVYIDDFNLLVSGKVKCYDGPCPFQGCPLGYLEITEVKAR
ncbi:hypothetical protein [Siphonobacter curvatus]|uniref:Uncharacterized protein n=1 Tax=Siphonobacter curvatus TaxID=2094562 RepID=A0A2S7IIZ8_9BACT|nr:hypothetical protein [Siphonobacter curvatus]PQA56289.1 hypothetical protein C5O19_18260 [Siphonobacter curvatus]